MDSVQGISINQIDILWVMLALAVRLLARDRRKHEPADQPLQKTNDSNPPTCIASSKRASKEHGCRQQNVSDRLGTGFQVGTTWQPTGDEKYQRMLLG